MQNYSFLWTFSQFLSYFYFRQCYRFISPILILIIPLLCTSYFCCFVSVYLFFSIYNNSKTSYLLFSRFFNLCPLFTRSFSHHFLLSFSCFSFDNVSGVGDVSLLLGAFCHAIGCTSSFDGPLYYFMVSNFQSHSWKPIIPNARRHYDQTKRMLNFCF